MSRLDNTSTRRAKDSNTSSRHGLMTPPPTPRKPRHNQKHKDKTEPKRIPNIDMPKEVLEGKKAKWKTHRKCRREAARAGERAHNNNLNKSVKHKQPALPCVSTSPTPTPLSVTAQPPKAPRPTDQKPTVGITQLVHHPASPEPSSSVASDLDLDLEHLMTLHFQRNSTFTRSSNPLEELLATDDFTAHNYFTSQDPSSCTALSATHEFIRGMQHEQSELCRTTDELELQIRKIKSTTSTGSWGLITAADDRARVQRLERMLGLTIALCFELLLEEGAFRDVCDRKIGKRGFDLGRELELLKGRVGAMVLEYDLAAGELRRGG